MRLNRTKKELKKYIIFYTAIIVIASVMTFAFVEFIDNYIINKNYEYDPIYALGMIIPMSIVITGISYFSLNNSIKQLHELINGIDNVSNKNYNYKIMTNKKDPMYEVYQLFNKMTDELSSVQILRKDFISNFSHEFKTPISAIHGFSEVLLEDDITETERKKYLEIIRDESRRLTYLSEKIMMMSKIDSKSFDDKKEEYSLDKQIKDIVILLENKWEEKNINMNVDLKAVDYIGNKELMNEVWINLINNAIKYTPTDGQIAISMKKSHDKIIVVIKDSGIGIEKDKLKFIFDEYYQIDESHSKDGVGLGLSIVKKILDIENATIEVDSQIGSGSTFKVILR